MPCYEVAIEARKNDTAEKCMFSAWIRGENTPKAVEEALQKVAYEHPDFGMLRPVCVEEQKLVAAYWQGTSAPRRQWKIVHKYKVEYRSPVSNRELLKKSYVWAVSAEEAVGYAKENVGISGLIVNAEESIATTIHQVKICAALSRSSARCWRMFFICFAISNLCTQKFLLGIFSLCRSPNGFCTTDTGHCTGTPDVLSCALLCIFDLRSSHVAYSPRPTYHRQCSHNQDDSGRIHDHRTKENFTNQILCTRKRALEPHAWSGPVMRCTSFSSGIGQKS